jgi:hypothetical protein
MRLGVRVCEWNIEVHGVSPGDEYEKQASKNPNYAASDRQCTV